jgi:hypothetical protein
VTKAPTEERIRKQLVLFLIRFDDAVMGSVRAAANSADRPCRRAGTRADSSAAGAAGSADPVNPQQGSCPPDGGSRRCSLHHRRGTIEEGIEEGSPGTVIERRSIFSNSSAPPLSVTSLQRLILKPSPSRTVGRAWQTIPIPYVPAWTG